MSTKAQVKTQAKTPAVPAAAHIPQPPVAGPEHEAERPDMATQLEGAARLGHSLGAIGVDGSAPPIIQTGPLIQRQEMLEEEEEEQQLKREPAALQRQVLPEGEEEELMMRPEEGRVGPQGGQVPPGVEAAIHRARAGGQPLDSAVHTQMGEMVGHDLSDVRVHSDAEADALTQQLGAKAFTTGPDIFFRQGEYNPGTGSGRELIGHELTHVVQQRTGRVGAETSGMAVRPVGDAFEQEAADIGRGAKHEIKKRFRGRPSVSPDADAAADILALQRYEGSLSVADLIAHSRSSERSGPPRAPGLGLAAADRSAREWCTIQRTIDAAEHPTNPDGAALAAMMCNDSVGAVLEAAGHITAKEKQQRFSTTAAAVGWASDGTEVTTGNIGNIPDNAVIGMAAAKGVGPYLPAHVMLSAGAGWAYGSNNVSIFGGGHGWRHLELAPLVHGAALQDVGLRSLRIHYRTTGPLSYFKRFGAWLGLA